LDPLSPFREQRPAGLAEIWRTQRPIRGEFIGHAAAHEEHVLAKPWFDRQD